MTCVLRFFSPMNLELPKIAEGVLFLLQHVSKIPSFHLRPFETIWSLKKIPIKKYWHPKYKIKPMNCINSSPSLWVSHFFPLSWSWTQQKASQLFHPKTFMLRVEKWHKKWKKHQVVFPCWIARIQWSCEFTWVFWRGGWCESCAIVAKFYQLKAHSTQEKTTKSLTAHSRCWFDWKHSSVELCPTPLLKRVPFYTPGTQLPLTNSNHWLQIPMDNPYRGIGQISYSDS